MPYKIKICYQTGDSEHSYETEDILDIEWENLDLAKENLQRLKEHHNMYVNLNEYHKEQTNFEILNENIEKKWFVYTPRLYSKKTNNAIEEKDKIKVGDDNWEYRPDITDAEYDIKFVLDNGNTYQIYAFWQGHFENIHSAEIIATGLDLLKIEFN